MAGNKDNNKPVLVVKPSGPLHGVVGKSEQFSLPGDKSISHRAALFAAMAEGESIIENFLDSGVTRVMLEALTDIGVKWERREKNLRLEGKGLSAAGRYVQKYGAEIVINCGNSATTMRLLAGALPAMGISAILDGSKGLRSRPMDRIVEPLSRMGVVIESDDGCAPLRIQAQARVLSSITYKLPVASAQVKSCLLLAALAAKGNTILREPGPSRDHTERMLRCMGVDVLSSGEVTDTGRNKPITDSFFLTELKPPNPMILNPIELSIPGDISAASFLIVAALICPGSEIKLEDVGLNPTRTGLLDALTQMGADTQISKRREIGTEPVGDIVIRASPLRGITVSDQMVVRMIDEFPIFAVAASYAQGTTLVKDAGELRFKETDRISSLVKELRKLGVDCQENPDGFIIEGGIPPLGGSVETHGDHRLAMALAVAGLQAQNPVEIMEPGIFNESFPDFFSILGHLSADVQIPRRKDLR